MAHATFSPFLVSGSPVFSTDYLTVTSASGLSWADSSATCNGGLYYIEFTPTVLTSGSTKCGVVSLTTATGVIVNFLTGSIYIGSTPVGSLGAGSAGTVYGMAVNVTTKMVWFRQGATGYWNGSSTADPVAGVGGFSFPAGSMWVPSVTVGATSDSVTMNSGDSAFSGSAPSGYTSGWPAAGDGTTAPSSVWTTLTTTTGGAVLSNGDLTAQSTSGAGTAGSVDFETSGKYYFEYHINNTAGVYAPAGGASDAGATYTILAVWNGFVYLNSSPLVAWAPYGTGLYGGQPHIHIALDLDNQSVWIRNGPSGYWNSSSTADPATNTGGLSLAGSIPAGTAYAPLVTLSTTGDQITLNAGQLPFDGTVPTGFTPGWPTAGIAPLSASAGAFSLSGNNATLVNGYIASTAAGSFSSVGSDATLKQTHKLTSTPGVFVVSSAGASVYSAGTVWRVTAANGVFSLSGRDATLKQEHKLTAAAGVFSLAGPAISVIAGDYMGLANGAFALSGVGATLRYQHVLATAPGAFSVTSGGNYLKVTLSLAPGAFALYGSDLTVVSGGVLAVGTGAFAVAGSPMAVVVGGVIMQPATGVFTLAGAEATFHVNHALSPTTGAFNLSGGGLAWETTVNLAAGAFVLVGSSGALKARHQLTSTVGAFTVSPQTAALTSKHELNAQQATYVVAPVAASPSRVRVTTVVPGVFTVASPGALAVRRHHLSGGAGGFTIFTRPAGLLEQHLLAAGPGDFAIQGKTVYRYVPQGAASVSWGVPTTQTSWALRAKTLTAQWAQ